MESNQINGRSLAIWGGAALLIAFIAIGAVKFADNGEGNTPSISGNLEPVSEADWVFGDIDAPVVLVEYSDFQCPACAAYFPLIEEVLSTYKDDVALVYRHFPLAQHRQAKAAAYASEAAGRQGKFWEMYKVLFEKQTEWAGKGDAKEIFEKYASTLGLDIEKFRIDVDLSEVSQKVDSNYRGGLKAQVNATPTFFLNGEKIKSPGNLEGFKQLIDAALATTT